MKTILYVTTFFLFYGVTQGATGSSNITIDSICKNRRYPKHGFCRRPEDCKSLEQIPVAQLSLCSTDKYGPIVCCPDEPERISERMCWETFFRHTVSHRVNEVADNGKVVVAHMTWSPSGGKKTKPKEFRQMAAIGWLQPDSTVDFKCGGTLIDGKHVITAAHCLGTRPDLVRLGGVNIANKSIIPTDIYISDVFIHPEYKSPIVYNDIAILKLLKNGITKDSVPACLWTRDHINVTHLEAIGYGQTSFAGPRTDDLVKVNLTLFDNRICKNIYDEELDFRQPHGIAETHLCAGHTDGEQDTCQGDSGGPIGAKIVRKFNEKIEEIFYIMGVTSYGQACGGVDAAIYTRITSYLDWIESVIWRLE